MADSVVSGVAPAPSSHLASLPSVAATEMAGSVVRTPRIKGRRPSLGGGARQNSSIRGFFDRAAQDEVKAGSTISPAELALELRKFLPDALVRDCLEAPKEELLARSRPLRGAVLFADASGFTALTEKLAEKANGAEVLAETLNRYFGAIIGVAAAHGGDVISFSGDAVTILWRCADESFGAGALRAAAQIACRCALAMHAELLTNTLLGDCPFRIHSGVGAGELFRLHLGGVAGQC